MNNIKDIINFAIENRYITEDELIKFLVNEHTDDELEDIFSSEISFDSCRALMNKPKCDNDVRPIVMFAIETHIIQPEDFVSILLDSYSDEKLESLLADEIDIDGINADMGDEELDEDLDEEE